MLTDGISRHLPPAMPRIPYDSHWQRNLAIGLSVTGVLLVGIGILGVLRNRGILSALPLSGRALQIAGFGGGTLCITAAGVLGTVSIYRHRGNLQKREALPPSFLDLFKQRALRAEKPTNCDQQTWQTFVNDITHYQIEADLISNMPELHNRLLALSNHCLSTPALREIYRMIIGKIPDFQVPSGDILQLQREENEPPIIVSRALARGYSPTLNGALASRMREAAGNPRFPLDADREIVMVIREFIQTNSAPSLNGENVQKVWECAKFLQIQELSDICRSYFMEHLEITPQNVLDLCYWGELHGEFGVLSRAIRYLRSMPEGEAAALGKHPTWGIATYDVVQYIRSEPAHASEWPASFVHTPQLLSAFVAPIKELPQFSAFVTAVNQCFQNGNLATKWSELYQKLLAGSGGRLDTSHLRRLYRFLLCHIPPSQVSPTDIVELRPNDGSEPFVVFRALAEACHFVPPPSDHPSNHDRETVQIVADFIQTGRAPLLNDENITRIMAYASQDPRFLFYIPLNHWLLINRCSIGDIFKFYRLAEENNAPDLLQVCLNKIKALPKDQLHLLGHHPVWGQKTPQFLQFLSNHQMTFFPDGTTSVVITRPLGHLNLSISILRTLRIAELKSEERVDIFPLALGLMASCSTLRSLDLGGHRLGEDKTKQLAECLRGNNTLVHLSLDSCEIGWWGANAIAATVQHHPTLRSLSLAYNRFGPDFADLFANVLKGPCGLEVLNLKHNFLGDEGARILAEGLRNNRVLNTLDLSANDVKNKGARAIGELLSVNPAIVRLNLSNNGFYGDGADSLAQGIKSHKKLIALAVSGCQISFDGWWALALALCDCTKLSELDISHNDFSGGSEYEYIPLFTSLLWKKSLTKLNLGDLKLPQAVTPAIIGVINKHLQSSPDLGLLDLSGLDLSCSESLSSDLYELLTSCRKIRVLRLNSCHLGLECSPFSQSEHIRCDLITRGIASCEQLTELSLGENHVSVDAIKYILSACKRLSSVCLSACHLGSVGLRDLRDTLAANTSLRSLHLGNNSIDSSGIEDLIAILRVNRTLRELNLIYNNFGAADRSAIMASNHTLSNLYLN